MSAVAARLGLGVALLVVAGFARAAWAESDSRVVRAGQLVLTSDASTAIEIGTDRGLTGQIRLEADETLSCVSVAPGASAVISTAGCADDLGTLRITISPDMPVSFTGNSEAEVSLADIDAPLTVTLTGEASLKAGRAGSLALAMRGSGDAAFGTIAGPASLEVTGSGDVRLGALHGPLRMKRRGSGDVVVGSVETQTLDIDSAGSGDTVIGSGHIANLTVTMAGSGDLGVAAEVGNGRVDVVGGGDVRLGRVTGTLQRSSAGGSSITVGGSAIVTEVMGRAARAVGEADVPGRDHGGGAGRPSMVGHFLTIGLVIVMLILVWRIVRRSGGLRAWNRPKPAGGPLHPGVLGVCETMTRLEQRLGRLESYVTTREFDLNRKFRDLGR